MSPNAKKICEVATHIAMADISINGNPLHLYNVNTRDKCIIELVIDRLVALGYPEEADVLRQDLL